jgi:hypothetical protein
MKEIRRLSLSAFILFLMKPRLHSPLEFVLALTLLVTAVLFTTGGTASADITLSTPPPVDEALLRPGLKVTEFPRHTKQVDEDHLLLPRDQFGDPIGHSRVAESLAPWTWNSERNAEASGLLQVPADGDYRFCTGSFYDRNILLIDGKEVCAFRDGEETVSIVPLKKGRVRITSLGFASSRGDSGITIRWQPPGQAELSTIPPRLLWHEGSGGPITFSRKGPAKAPPADLSMFEPGLPLFESGDASFPSRKGAPFLAEGSSLLSIEGPLPMKFRHSLAQEIITVTDDFVVEAYKNGWRVRDDRRKLLEEVFGTTVERITVHVDAGDWLVFHVVNNRLRWEGAKYFAVAGITKPGHFGFVSDPASGDWFVCDDPAKAPAFISQRDAGTEVRASAIAKPWDSGDAQMRKHAGQRFPGKPLWGGAQSTWIKFVASEDAKPLPTIASPTPKPTPTPAPEKSDPVAPKLAPVEAKPPVTPTRWPVQVLTAHYGTGGKIADVTARVKELVENQRKLFSVDPPTLGADPNPYWNKNLWVLYMKDGVRREKNWGENSHVLPETFYGPQDAPELTKWLPGTRWRGATGEVQFHADRTLTGAGIEGAPQWEALANNRIRITWSADRKPEYHFDYTWGKFHESTDAAKVYHLVK